MSAIVALPDFFELLTFHRRHAHAFGRRPGRISGVVARDITPSDIFPITGDRAAWWRGDLGITLNLGRSSSWLDIWFAENLQDGTAGNQPLYEATGLLGRPCVTNDDGARRLTCTLSSPLPAGSRMYAFCVFQWIAVGGATFMLAFGELFGANSYLGISAESPKFRGYRKETAALQDSTPTINRDTSPHRHELGYTTGGLESYVTDATSNPTSVTGAPGTSGSHVLLHRSIAGAAGPQAKCAEIVIVKADPTATQKAQMRAYLSARYPGLA